MEANEEQENPQPSDDLDKILNVQSRLIESDFDLLAFMDLVVEEMLTLTPATGVVIELVDGEDMVYRAATGTIKNYIGLRLSQKNSLSGACIQSHQVLRSDDTENDSRVDLNACRKVEARSIVVAPLFHDGNVVGVLKIVSKEPSAFCEKDVKTLQIMAGFIASALARQMLQEFRDFF